MKIPLAVSLVAAAVGAVAVSAPPPASASTAIQRCLSADGTFAYTDKGCATLGAQALPMPRELEHRIALDDGAQSGAGVDPDGADAAPTRRAAAPGRRSPASGCARSPRQLAADLRASLALGDVNRLAESYHWAGMSERSGARTLERLERLSRREVVDTNYYGNGDRALSGFADAGTLLASAGSRDAGASAGVMELVLGGGARSVVDFDVHRYAGCYFVAF